MFYLVCKDIEQRTVLISKHNENDIHAVFHYLSLHNSYYYQNKHDVIELPEFDKYSDHLLRFPLFYELENQKMEIIINETIKLCPG